MPLYGGTDGGANEEAINQFMELNDISAEEIIHALHMDIREIILKTVCDKLKTDNDFFIRTKKLYFLWMIYLLQKRR